jgi:DNA-binding NarL/FixJ family response regulator
MPSLTQREQQVLEQVAQGASSKEIARALNLSPRTIGVYRSNLLHKLGARNTADLVRKSLSGETETI